MRLLAQNFGNSYENIARRPSGTTENISSFSHWSKKQTRKNYFSMMDLKSFLCRWSRWKKIKILDKTGLTRWTQGSNHYYDPRSPKWSKIAVYRHFHKKSCPRGLATALFILSNSVFEDGSESNRLSFDSNHWFRLGHHRGVHGPTLLRQDSQGQRSRQQMVVSPPHQLYF